jgi:hypothetical protein
MAKFINALTHHITKWCIEEHRTKYGLFQTFEWRCQCGESFDSRTKAMAHYRQKGLHLAEAVAPPP